MVDDIAGAVDDLGKIMVMLSPALTAIPDELLIRQAVGSGGQCRPAPGALIEIGWKSTVFFLLISASIGLPALAMRPVS